MKHSIILIFASVISSINSRSIGPSLHDEDALVLQIGISGTSGPAEIPNNLDDLTTGESISEDLINSANNYNPNDQSDGLILSKNEENMENLFTDLVTDYQQQAGMQWLKSLKLTIDQILSENSSVTKFPKNLDGLNYIVETIAPYPEILRTVNGFKDLVDSADDLNIYYQEGQAESEHVKSRYENFLAPISLIRDKFSALNHPDSKIDEEATKSKKKSTKKELNLILSDLLQGEVNWMRNYFENDCRRHNHEATSSKNSIPMK